MRAGAVARTVGGLATATALLLATACGGTGAAGATVGGSPRAGGELAFATDTDPGCLDPHQALTAGSQLISRPVVDSLVSQNPRTSQLEPWLATSWTVSPDATSFTFQLRDGVTFSDGTPFDAAAVKANLDRIAAPETRSVLAAGMLDGYLSTTVTDRSAVVVSFSKPNGPFLQAASTAFLGMLSPTAFAAGPQVMCGRPVGSGPFVVTDRVPQQSVTLGRRTDYDWGTPGAGHQGAAYLDTVAVSVVPQSGVRVGSLRTGQVDAIGGVPPADVGGLAGFPVLGRAQPGLPYSIMVNATREPWTDLRLRQALSRAIDTDQIVDTIYDGRYPRATSVLTPATPGYANVLPDARFDRAAAEELLDGSGWLRGADGMRSRDGIPLTLEWIYITPAREQRDLVAQLAAQQLEQVGIAVRLTPLPADQVTARTAQGDWQLNDISFVRADGDVLRTVLTSPGSGFPSAQAPQVADLLTAATTTTEPSRREADYREAQRLIVEQAASVPVYDPTYLLGTNDAVRDLAFDPQGQPSFYDAWLAR